MFPKYNSKDFKSPDIYKYNDLSNFKIDLDQYETFEEERKTNKNKPSTNNYKSSNNVYLSVRDEKFNKIENNY